MRESALRKISPTEYWGKGGVLLCTAGSACATVNGKPLRIERGTALILTPLVVVNAINPADDFAHLSFADDLKTFYPIFHLIADTNIPLMLRRDPLLKIPDEGMPFFMQQDAQIERLSNMLSEAATEKERTVIRYRLLLSRQQTMLEIGSRLLSLCPEKEFSNHRETAVYRFILSLHEKYRQHRTVSYYASEASLSTGRFSAIVREVTQKTPSRWIADVTVSYAKIMLEQSDRTIKQIAACLNFPEQFTFRKYFKSHVGLSPTEYRRLLRTK